MGLVKTEKVFELSTGQEILISEFLKKEKKEAKKRKKAEDWEELGTFMGPSSSLHLKL